MVSAPEHSEGLQFRLDGVLYLYFLISTRREEMSLPVFNLRMKNVLRIKIDLFPRIIKGFSHLRSKILNSRETLRAN